MKSLNENNMFVKYLKDLIEKSEVDIALPEELANNKDYSYIYNSLLEIRNAFMAIAKGNLSFNIKSKGYFCGAVKSLQASLKHLVWQTNAISNGDFSQRVDFLGAFSDAFNSMTKRLQVTIQQLEKEEIESREEKERFEMIFNSTPDGAFIARLNDNAIININDGFTSIFGYTNTETIEKNSLDINLYIDINDRKKLLDELTDKGFCENREVVLRKKNGGTITVLISAKTISLKGELHYISIMRDISERKKVEAALRASEEKYRLLTEFASDVIWVLNLSLGKFTYISPTVYQLRGLTAEEAMAESLEESLTPESVQIVNNAIERNIAEFIKNPNEPNFYINEIQQPCKDGKIIWIEVSTKFRYNAEGQIEIVGVSRNIEERKKTEEEVLYLSYHDQLTGLYNRRFYEIELKRIDAERNLPITLIMADVNGLKLTNDAFGHLFGDRLLKTVADILKKECRADDIVARIGGDEFVILLLATDSLEAEQIVNRIKNETLGKQLDNMILSVSFGWGTKNNIDDDVSNIYTQAEDHMYRHKLSESKSMKSETIKLITKSLYEKDSEVQQHCEKVSKLCRKIGIALGLTSDAVDELELAGLLHDIGKIGIDEKILHKPDRLNEDEWLEIKRHPEIGYQILRSVNEFAQIADYILAHHEREDGKGYPRGLKSNEISIQSKILSIADAYDAMISDRVYKKALSKNVAIEEIKNKAGTQFDAEIAKVFIKMVSEKGK